MIEYLITLVLYLFTQISIYFLTSDVLISLAGKLILSAIPLIIFRKSFPIKLKFSIIGLFSGIFIFIIWIMLEGRYPLLGSASVGVPLEGLTLLLRLTSVIILAPIIEEFFTRYFLNRFVQSENWQRLPVHSFTLSSFVITTAFFAFSHDRWLPGLIAGITLNWVLIKTKDINACVFAHMVANILLVVYVLTTNSWQFL